MARTPASEEKARDDARQAFVARAMRALERLSESAPRGLLMEALAQPSDYGSLAYLMASDLAVDPAYRALDPYAGMRARAEALKATLAERAGGLAAAGELVREMHITRQALSKAAGEDRLLAIRTAGGLLFPRCQFHEGRPVPGLAAVLQALKPADPWTRLSFLVSANARLDGRSPLEALRAGEREAAAAAAAGFGGHGG